MAAETPRNDAEREKESERLRQDLATALAQHAAMSEILRLMASSPGDLQRVLGAVAESAARACGMNDALVRVVEGDQFWCAAGFGPIGQELGIRQPIDRDAPSGRVILDRQTLHVEDM